MKTTTTTTKTVTPEEVIELLEEHYGGKMTVGKREILRIKPYQFRHQVKTDSSKVEQAKSELEWVPDGETCPPSREAFLAWAEGKKVCMIGSDWNKNEYIEALRRNNDDSFFSCVSYWNNHNGLGDVWKWERNHWQEYTGETK